MHDNSLNQMLIIDLDKGHTSYVDIGLEGKNDNQNKCVNIGDNIYAISSLDKVFVMCITNLKVGDQRKGNHVQIKEQKESGDNIRNNNV